MLGLVLIKFRQGKLDGWVVLVKTFSGEIFPKLSSLFFRFNDLAEIRCSELNEDEFTPFGKRASLCGDW